MELHIHVIFAFSRNFPDVPGVFGYEMFDQLPGGARGPTTRSTVDVPRDGSGSDNRIPLLKGMSDLLGPIPFQRGTVIRIFTREKFIVDGLNGRMFEWQANGWRNFHEGERIRYTEHWESFIHLVEDKGVNFQCIHLNQDDDGLSRIREIAEARREFLKAQRGGA